MLCFLLQKLRIILSHFKVFFEIKATIFQNKRPFCHVLQNLRIILQPSKVYLWIILYLPKAFYGIIPSFCSVFPAKSQINSKFRIKISEKFELILDSLLSPLQFPTISPSNPGRSPIRNRSGTQTLLATNSLYKPSNSILSSLFPPFSGKTKRPKVHELP